MILDPVSRMRLREGKRSRLTAAGLLSTENNTAKTASAMPSLSMLPSHSTSTSPSWYRTVTQPMTRYAAASLLVSRSAAL